MALNFFSFLNKGNKGPAIQPQAGDVPTVQAPPVEKKEKGRPGRAPSVRGTPGVVDEYKTAPQVLAEGMLNIRDIIAPSAIEVDFNYLKIGQNYYRTIFVSGYPRFVGANWLSQIINFEHSLDISMFYYPVKARLILDDLRRKITELEATELADREKGRVTDPVVRAALEDAQSLQEQLVKGVEKYFQFSFYITISAKSLEELDQISSQLESTLGALLLISKPATLQMEEAFQSTIPCASDKLLITRNMDTTSLATTFPFTSSDLTSDEGIMYGINMHNGSLVIFDRFSMENANTVVFAKSGAGKSYFVKLEALRLMVFGAEVMIIDPEEEYRTLCDAVGGNYIDFSPNSASKINPFDLSNVVVEGENELSQKLISLHTLLQLMLGDLDSTEQAILDRALIETYRIKGITKDPESQMNREPPVMEDLYKVLRGAQEPEAKGMADRLEKYIRGSLAGIFDSQSTIDIGGMMTVFSTKHIEDEILRPVAFYIILDFVWTRIRRDLKRRILIVEEAWYLMQNEDSARFIYGVAKRARKYYLGLTTISQDVDDFLGSEHGHAIVTNSSIQILLKQHPAAIDKVAKTFYLSEGERRLLLAANIGEGLFFAGSNHVAIQIKASPAEHKLITTDPEEILRLREEGIIKEKEEQTPVYRPVGNADVNKYEMIDEQGNPKVTVPPIPQATTQPAASPRPQATPLRDVPPAETTSPMPTQSGQAGFDKQDLKDRVDGMPQTAPPPPWFKADDEDMDTQSQKDIESKPVESKPFEPKPVESKTFEPKPIEPKPFEAKPVELKFEEKKTEEIRPKFEIKPGSNLSPTFEQSDKKPAERSAPSLIPTPTVKPFGTNILHSAGSSDSQTTSQKIDQPDSKTTAQPSDQMLTQTSSQPASKPFEQPTISQPAVQPSGHTTATSESDAMSAPSVPSAPPAPAKPAGPSGLPPLPDTNEKKNDANVNHTANKEAKEDKGNIAQKFGAGLGSLLGFGKKDDNHESEKNKTKDQSVSGGTTATSASTLAATIPQETTPSANTPQTSAPSATTPQEPFKRPQTQAPPRTETPTINQQNKGSGTFGLSQNNDTQGEINTNKP